MSSETVTLWHDGLAVMIYKAVAEKHGNPHTIYSRPELMEIIADNARYGIALCQQKMKDLANTHPADATD